MIPTLFIHLHIKFRFAGITWGTLEKQLRVTINPISWGGDSSPIPNTARAIVNERGVLLQVWTA